jgi:hypothetical protein
MTVLKRQKLKYQLKGENNGNLMYLAIEFRPPEPNDNIRHPTAGYGIFHTETEAIAWVIAHPRRKDFTIEKIGSDDRRILNHS